MADYSQLYAAQAEIEARRRAEQEAERKKLLEKEETERKKILQKLQEKDKTLRQLIRNCCDKESNEYVKVFLKVLEEAEVKDQISYDQKEWLFNNGKLRTRKEVIDRELELKKLFYQSNPKLFEKECKTRNFLSTVIPMATITGFFVIKAGLEFGFDSPCVFLDGIFMPSPLISLSGFLGLWISHKHNADLAKEYDINTTWTKYEKKELTMAGISSALAILSLTRDTKKHVKSLLDVDSWKKL